MPHISEEDLKNQISTLDSFNSKILDFAIEQKLKNDLEILRLQKQNKDFEEIINITNPVVEKEKPIVQNITNKNIIKNCDIVSMQGNILQSKGNDSKNINVEKCENFTSN